MIAREGRAWLVTTALVVMTGAPVGLLWAAIAPKVHVQQSAAGLSLASSETKAFIAADGWFFFLALIAGALCGAAAWGLGRRASMGTALGLLGGSILAAVVAWRVGHLVDVPRLHDVLAQLRGDPLVDPTLDIRAKAVLLVWPAAALGTFVALLGTRPAPVQHPGPRPD